MAHAPNQPWLDVVSQALESLDALSRNHASQSRCQRDNETWKNIPFLFHVLLQDRQDLAHGIVQSLE